MLTNQLNNFAGGDEHSLLDDEGEVVNAHGRPPSEEELTNGYAAPGDDALLSCGITYSSNWKLHADGIAKHAREQVLALASTGLPIGLRSIGTGLVLAGELHPDVLEVGYLENVSFTRTLIAIKHIILHDPETLRRIICPAAGTLQNAMVDRVYRSTVVYTSWERDRVHPEYVEILNRLGQVWVPCMANYEAFANSGVSTDRLWVVPYPFDPNSGICRVAAPRGKEDVPAGKRFYNIGKWEPRKNQHQLLGAFLTSFSPKDKASLLFKTSPFGGAWSGYPSPEESVNFWLNEADVKANGWTADNLDRLVRIIFGKISEKDLIEIHAKNNIYVSAAHGEAWDIPAFEAKLAGNRLVHVGYGGSEDYWKQGQDIMAARIMGPVHPGYGWEPGAQWAKTSVEAIGAAMKSVELAPRRVMDPHLAARFSRAAVGLHMKNCLYALAIELDCLDMLRDAGGFG